jgi:NADH:ubiquinone oxidoreductase subunit 3 (subunit A)
LIFSKEHLQIFYLLFLFLGIFFVMLGIWAIDIGVSGMVLNAQYSLNIVATNGWWSRDPCVQYHIGLYFVMFGIIITILVAISSIVFVKNTNK